MEDLPAHRVSFSGFRRSCLHLIPTDLLPTRATLRCFGGAGTGSGFSSVTFFFSSTMLRRQWLMDGR